MQKPPAAASWLVGSRWGGTAGVVSSDSRGVAGLRYLLGLQRDGVDPWPSSAAPPPSSGDRKPSPKRPVILTNLSL